MDMQATIGRKVWFWMSSDSIEESASDVRDEKQAFDATVVFVHPDGCVNLKVIDHSGEEGVIEHAPFREYSADDTEHGGAEDFCTWMPYQMNQAKKLFEEAKAELKGVDA